MHIQILSECTADQAWVFLTTRRRLILNTGLSGQHRIELNRDHPPTLQLYACCPGYTVRWTTLRKNCPRLGMRWRDPTRIDRDAATAGGLQCASAHTAEYP